jgi:Ca2+-binding RTX toxin-like protein
MSEKRYGLRDLGIGTLIFAVSACGVPQGSEKTTSGPDDDFTSTHQLLTAACTFDGSGNPTITVDTGETAYLFKRAADGLVVANTLNGSGTECTFATTKKVTINALTAASDNHKVLLDYYAGTFGMATAAFSGTVAGSGPKTVLALGTGINNQVKFRGTANADTFTFGTLSTTSYLALGVGSSATMAATARTYPDVSLVGATDIVVTAGPGNDVVTGQGGLPIGGTVALPGPLVGTIGMTVYGGDGNDTITSGAAGVAVNHLYGENGNDTFLQQVAKAHDVISGTNALGAADTDTVDYSVRTGALTITLGDDAAATAAVGQITTVAAASLANNDRFTINDGTTSKLFEFKKTGGYVATAMAVTIDGSALTTAASVAAATLTAISGAGLTLTATQPDITTGDLTITLPLGARPAAAHITSVVGTSAVITDFAGGSAAILANDGEASEADSLNADIENVIGGSAADRIDASLSTLAPHVLQGMAGDDTLIGSDLADALWGGPGDDTLKGGLLVDTLNGGDGNDTLQGGLGNDNIDGGGLNCVAASSAICTTTFAAKGAAAVSPGINTLDYADRTSIQPVIVDLSMLMAAAQVGGAGEKDVVTAASIQYLRGGAGDDTLTGDINNNIIWGGAGVDTINGNDGNDALYGEAGDDVISGGNGDDFISGGPGLTSAQVLNGDANNDFIDNTAATGGTVDCGAGDADILLTNGTESAMGCE